MDADVLIVGAGPTGLMLANQLGRRAVRTLIIDRHAGPARETRALAGALGLPDLLRVHSIGVDPYNGAALARAGVPVPSYYLLRPDGHVGLCGARVDNATLVRYLAERLHIAGLVAAIEHHRS